jgi:muramoyltetrapeptide carboxypeptidase
MDRVVGIWAGSSPSRKKDFNHGLRLLKGWGLTPKIPATTLAHACRPESRARAFLAGPDLARARALAELWKHPTLQTIFAVRGGYGGLRLLPHLDTLLQKPATDKIVWGYSDLTVVQNYLHARFGSAWVHAPMLTSHALLSPVPRETTAWKSAARAEGGRATRDHSLKVLHRPRRLPSALGRSRGLPLLGGNLTSLVSLFGTRWQPHPRADFLLFLEDVNEAPYRVDRLFQQLSGSDYLRRCAGIVLGHFTRCPRATELARLWAHEHDILLMSGLPAGHESPNLPLSMGVPVTLDFKKRTHGTLTVPNPRL